MTSPAKHRPAADSAKTMVPRPAGIADSVRLHWRALPLAAVLAAGALPVIAQPAGTESSAAAAYRLRKGDRVVSILFSTADASEDAARCALYPIAIHRGGKYLEARRGGDSIPPLALADPSIRHEIGGPGAVPRRFTPERPGPVQMADSTRPALWGRIDPPFTGEDLLLSSGRCEHRYWKACFGEWNRPNMIAVPAAGAVAPHAPPSIPRPDPEVPAEGWRMLLAAGFRDVSRLPKSWRVPDAPGAVTDLRSADLDGDGVPELFGTVEFDAPDFGDLAEGATPRVLAAVAVHSDGPRPILDPLADYSRFVLGFVDANGDGKREAVLSILNYENEFFEILEYRNGELEHVGYFDSYGL